MLRLVILIALFFLIFFIIYKNLKKFALFWTNELSEKESLKDTANKIKIERNLFNENLKEAEKKLKNQEKEIENLKKKGI